MTAGCGEFELIRRYFSSVGTQTDHPSGILCGVGDDCAVLRVPTGHDLVFSLDTLVEGVHFPAAAPARLLASRALRVTLSDLAAMGAKPFCFTLGLTLPAVDESWLSDFSAGLSDVASLYGIPLVGGDTTRGPLTISIEVKGLVPQGEAVLRSGAKPGDIVCVSGTLGDAGAALDFLSADLASVSEDGRKLLDRYWAPIPRFDLADKLRQAASAAIDISDGLVADLGHILAASSLAADIDLDAIPTSKVLQRVCSGQAKMRALSAGDDYEICFCMPEQSLPVFEQEIAQGLITPIGRTRVGEGVVLLDAQGMSVDIAQQGYQHF